MVGNQEEDHEIEGSEGREEYEDQRPQIGALAQSVKAPRDCRIANISGTSAATFDPRLRRIAAQG